MQPIQTDEEALNCANEKKQREFDRATEVEFASKVLGMKVWILGPQLLGSSNFIAADGVLFHHGVHKYDSEEASIEALKAEYQKARAQPAS